MRTRYVLLSALVLCACEVPLKNAGDVEGTSSEDTSNGEEDSGAAEGGSTTVDASFALDAGLHIRQLMATEQGLIAVLESAVSTSETGPVSVVGLSFDLEPMWEVDLGVAGIQGAAPLDDGGALITGFVDPSEAMPIASAWKLSCCGQLAATQTYDSVGGFGVLAAGEPIADGFALVRHDELFSSSVLWVDDDLTLTSTSESLPLLVQDSSVGSDGQMVLLGIESAPGPAALIEVDAQAVGDGWGLGGGLALIGRGEGLSILMFDTQELGFRPYDGGAVHTVAIPDLRQGAMAGDHRTHYVFAQTWNDDDTIQSGSSLTEFDAQGETLRSLAFDPGPASGHAVVTAVAIGPDDAVYFALSEGDYETLVTTLQRLPPL